MENFMKNPYSLARKGISSLMASESMEATLTKKFKHSKFSKRFWLVNLALIFLAYAVQIASLITAVFMLYYYFGNVPIMLRIPLLLVVVFVIEIVKRIALDDVLKSAFQYREFEPFSFSIAAVFIGLSITISYGGASIIAQLMIKREVVAAPVLKSDEEIKTSYQQQITAVQEERNALRTSRTYKGKLRKEDQRAIDKHNETIKNLENQQRIDLQALEEKNNEITAATAALAATSLAELQLKRQSLQQQLEYAVIGFEALLLMCLCFSWWFYNNCRKEQLGLAETAAEENPTAVVTTAAVTTAVTAAEIGQAAPILNKKKIGFKDYETSSPTTEIAAPTTEKEVSTTVEKALEYTRKCPVCDVGFIHNSWNHTYCSDNCKIKAWEQRTNKKFTRKKKA